jgi:tetratricopeptide (TPR) repeat protein
MTMNRITQIVVTVAAITIACAACATAVPPLPRGVEYYNHGNYLAAIEHFNAAVRATPNSAAPYNNRAIARVRIGDVTGAIEDYTRAIALAPYDAELYFNRGNAYVAAGQYSRALNDFNRAVQVSPAYARAWYNRGTVYSLMGQPDAAMQNWRYAIGMERDPWAKAAMRRSAGLDSRSASVPAGEPTVDTTVAPLAALPTTTSGVSLPARALAPDRAQPSASISAAHPSSPAMTDARDLASLAISRELDGDHAGALADLRAAIAMETDVQRRQSMTNLLRFLDPPR